VILPARAKTAKNLRDKANPEPEKRLMSIA
jgi:hypothetical protein